ncbi:hypothetical protein AB0A77_25170 [Streptomyces varsoviensis]|uniref:hypothetical protein n=1 Tax=Streptomyces varsoviensis TaxID=67373 RepID=UPI0033E47BFA
MGRRTAPLIVVNPGFEKGTEGWTFKGAPVEGGGEARSGVSRSRPFGGARHALLDARIGQRGITSVAQTVTAPANGVYSLSAWVAGQDADARFVLRRDGRPVAAVSPVFDGDYRRWTLTDVELRAGDRLEIAFEAYGGDTDAGWVAVDGVMVSPGLPARPKITSSSREVVEIFDWARGKAAGWVQQCGAPGPLNMDETSHRPPTAEAAYAPSYWAGYPDRTGYYARDTTHQVGGAHILGLDAENLTMLRSFAASATAEHRRWPVWAVNFDARTPLAIDYHSAREFVRELPAPFELVEKCAAAFRWSGDRRYLDGVLWDFCRRTAEEFVAQQAGRLAGRPVPVAGAAGTHIFDEVATYNESGERLVEAGDAVATQYRAYLAVAALADARDDTELVRAYRTRAARLRAYVNGGWTGAGSGAAMNRGYHADGTAVAGWGKENSWFMPLKGVLESGARNDAYLDYVQRQASSAEGRPVNAEALTYLPDVFFRHGRNEWAWQWMRHLYAERDKRHATRRFVNGDYPELSFTLISQLVEGMMGVEPDAPRHALTTLPRLPVGDGPQGDGAQGDGQGSVQWVEAADVPIGEDRFTLRHDGNTSTTLTLHAAPGTHYRWEARFPGTYRRVLVDGAELPADRFEAAGGRTGTTVTVRAGEPRTVSVAVSLAGG